MNEILDLEPGQYIGAVRHRYEAADLILTETTYGPGAVLPMHRHRNATFFLILTGSFVERSGRMDRVYSSGSFAFHPSDEPHGGPFHPVAGQHRGRGFNIEVGPGWTPIIGDASGTQPSREVAWLLGRLHQEFRTGDDARAFGVHGIMWELGAYLARARRRRTAGTAPEAVRRAVDALRASASGSVTWDEVATAAGLSPMDLARAFRARMGCTPAQYVRRARLESAAGRLATEHTPISTIALEAGFYDQPHFTRTFRRLMGVSPAAYRRAMRDPH